MKVGMLTAPMRDVGIEDLVKFAQSAGIGGLEISAAGKCAHFDSGDADLARRVAAVCADAGIEITSLAAYVDVTSSDPAARQANRDLLGRLLELCQVMGVGILCCAAGLPPAGKSKEDTIREDSAPFYRELAKRAADLGIKLALENWGATNIQNLSQWELMFELVPDDNFGLNFDPSHLVWQDIDYLRAVDVFGSRIFHTHAKDTEIVAHRKAWVGSQAGGWWRFVIPGLGEVDWGVYISRLRKAGFNGVLSIEHEDGAVGREEGFIMGAKHLQQFMA